MAFLDETGLAELWRLILNGVNHYVWEKTKSEYEKKLGAKETKTAGNNIISAWYMSDEVEIVNGAVTLANPVLVSNGANAIGKYVEGWNAGIYYVVSRSYADSVNYNYTVQSVTAVLNTTSYGYVSSPDANAYPIGDGYTYVPMGQLGETTRIATGSYTGTGKCGPNNPTSITFERKPKVFGFCNADGRITMNTSITTDTFVLFGVVDALSTSYERGTFLENRTVDVWESWTNTRYAANYAKVSEDGKTLSWYGADQISSSPTTDAAKAAAQRNASGTTYRYFAIL